VNGRCVIEAEFVGSKGWIAAAAHDGAQRLSVSPFTERGPSPSQHRRRKRSSRRRRKRRRRRDGNSDGSDSFWDLEEF
jgi:hypothetical protein